MYAWDCLHEAMPVRVFSLIIDMKKDIHVELSINNSIKNTYSGATWAANVCPNMNFSWMFRARLVTRFLTLFHSNNIYDWHQAGE